MEKTKFHSKNFGYRLIVSPFIFALIFIAHNLFVIKRFWHFLKFGGEYINFEEDESATIKDILAELKKQNEQNENN